MGLEFYQIVALFLVTFLASAVQSLTGFGFGILAMIFLPSLLAYSEANAFSAILSSLTSLAVVVSAFRKTNFKNLIFPLLGSAVTNYLAVSYVKNAKTDVLFLLLGIALFSLSVYFFFFSEKIRIKPTPFAGLIAGVISGVMSGLFSMGGPPVVVYYMQSEKDSDTYFSTISMYFVLSGVLSVSMKAAAGFVTRSVLWGLLPGVLGMLVGTLLGRGLGGRIPSRLVRKTVYGFMTASGLYYVVTGLIKLVA